jgi:hypothetical protein
MSRSQYSGRPFHPGKRRVGIIECGLALSVIIGLGFVSLRVLKEGPAMSWSGKPDTSGQVEKAEATSASGDVSTAP